VTKVCARNNLLKALAGTSWGQQKADQWSTMPLQSGHQ